MTNKKRPPSTQGPQSSRTIDPSNPSTTIQARTDRVGSGSPVLEWPWERPSTTVTSRPGLPPPGHHDESFAIMSLPDAIILSELAATILQGFPQGWVFAGKTKLARWSQIGQAMPPPLAHAVAASVAEQMRAA
jgi:site-specific DNA-cytosine methylase